MRSGAIACLILASCSQLAGLTDFSASAGGDEDGGVPPNGQSASAEVPSGVEAAPPGSVDSATPETGADASGGAASVRDAGASPEVEWEAAADTNTDAATGAVPDSGGSATDAGADSGVDAAQPTEMDAAPDVGPVLTFTPTSAVLSILASDAGVCSMNGTQSASLDLVNASDAGVTLMWIAQAPACSETSYGTVAPGANQSVRTYVTHVWRVVDQTSGQFVAEFRLDSAASYTVTVH
ncbi:MAG TPA: hypothetical protein VKU41_10825 [Polyangiaceae bacterium]|nr:hypothetical protein [Polyangiaceae bacterium]